MRFDVVTMKDLGNRTLKPSSASWLNLSLSSLEGGSFAQFSYPFTC